MDQQFLDRRQAGRKLGQVLLRFPTDGSGGARAAAVAACPLDTRSPASSVRRSKSSSSGRSAFPVVRRWRWERSRQAGSRSSTEI